jgi:hypothetical protein
MQTWPEWWQFDLVISPHVVARMEERNFNEIDLRTMLEQATKWRESAATGRFIIASSFEAQQWEIVVEPDEYEHLLIIVTAYAVE